MNIASIDIGSNTVLLLIAEISNENLKPQLNLYNSPRLGKGLKNGGKILDDRIDHLMDILITYKEVVEEYNCEMAIVTATNAMRIASNSDEIIDKIKRLTDFNVKVISGEEEARLSFLGASSSFPSFHERMVIDIGGGSTEVIFGKGNEIFFKKSFQTGVVSLTEKFLNEFPYTNLALDLTSKHLDKIFNTVEKEIPNEIPIIAVAGTPTSLSCINQGLKDFVEDKVEHSKLTVDDMDILYNELKEKKGDEIKSIYGNVVSGREDVLFSGLLILQHLQKIKSNNIINVSNRGLRYGNIINYMISLK